MKITESKLRKMIREVIKFELEEVNYEQSDFRKTNAEGYEEKRFSQMAIRTVTPE